MVGQHGAGYLAALERPAAGSYGDPDRPPDIAPRADYLATRRRDHGRKQGIWALVEGRATCETPEARRGRMPKWIAAGD